MENFTFYAPTYFAFGKDTENDTGKYVKRFGGSRVLLHYGGGSVIRSGLLDRVKKSLDGEGVSYVELGGVKPNPRSGLVYEGIDLCRKEKVDFVLAVGGGSTIDSAKAIAAGAVYDGDFWDYYEGKLVEEALPIGTVITISAAGSEGSPDSVITKEEGMFKRGATGEAFRPKFTIMNPALTQTLPAYQTACGITDIMAHLYERYLTNTEEVEVTDRMIEGLLLTMIHEGPSAGLAVVMPAVFTYTLEHNVMRFAQAAVRVWGCQMDFADPKRTALEGIEALRNFLISIGMPKNFAELGAKEEDIEKLAHTCCYGDVNTGTVEGFATLDQKDVENIYKLMVF